jgi:PII-like signaling protein
LVDAGDDLPLIVEIVDTAERVRRFAARLGDLVAHGTATLSPVRIVKYAAGEPA